MKRILAFLLLITLLLCSCGTQPTEPEAPTETEATAATEAPTETETPTQTEAPTETEAPIQTGKTLVAVFSRTGNTLRLAEAAADYLSADFYCIEALEPYTDADIAYYTDCRADREQNDPAVRPAIAGQVENMTQYDTIVLGYPIWHGQAPRIISTFLESYDLSDKTILPFCTSASSGIGSSDTDLHALCNANWLDGKRFAADADLGDFTTWLAENLE